MSAAQSLIVEPMLGRLHEAAEKGDVVLLCRLLDGGGGGLRGLLASDVNVNKRDSKVRLPSSVSCCTATRTILSNASSTE